MKTSEYKRICPFCGKDIYYATKRILVVAIKKNKRCKLCSRSGVLNHNFGKELIPSEETRLKWSIAQKRRYSDINERIKQSNIQKIRYSDKSERIKTSNLIKKVMRTPHIRKKHLEGLHHSKWIKVRTDKGQLELLNKWNKLGFSFEPNYQVKTDMDLFYVDGYDKKRNVVLEYDSKYHKYLNQKQKDLIRQQKIINILKPNKFWRYDCINKTLKNVLEK